MHNPARARKAFYNWLDRTRPWAQPKNSSNVYPMMEEMVDRASICFTGERGPGTDKATQVFEDHILKISESLSEHPEGWDGPCNFLECRNA